jgi:predicted transcriptional regulator
MEAVMNDTVTISRAEYEALVEAREDLEDLQAYDRVMANIASGADEAVPLAFVDRLLAGESAVRVYRDLRGLTQSGLAEWSGVNRVQIADIEAGRKSGSVATVRKLADALGVAVDDLI